MKVAVLRTAARVAMCLALVGCGAGQANSPRATLSAYANALADGRADDAYKMLSDETKRAMRDALTRIQSGEYARDFILENRAGAPTLNAKRRLLAEHDIEKVGEKLRAMMPWIKKNKLVDTSRN